MLEWKKVKLSELGEIVGGATPSTKREDYYNGNIPWLTPKDLSGYSSRYVSKGERSITKEGLDSCSAKILPKDSVLFTSRAPIGYVAIAENEICTNQGFKSIIPNKNTDPLFLFYLLKHNKERIEAMGSGTTFKEVSGSVMKNIEVDAPEYEEQKRISAILSSIDNLIEQNNQMNKNLEAQTQAIFKSWFVDFEPWGGVMPEDWREGTLGELCNIKHGYAFKGEFISDKANGKVLVTPGNFAIGGGFKKEKFRYFTTTFPESYVLQPKDLIVTMTDLSKECDTLGFSALVPSDENIYLHNQRIGLVENIGKNYSKYYVYWLLRTVNYQKYIVGSATGSTVKHTSPTRILSYKFAIPSGNIQKDFGSLFSNFADVMENNDRQSQTLTTLRETLLPKLMSGKIDVKEEV